MNYQNIAEIYEANDSIREKFKSVVGGLSDAQANNVPDGEKWSIAKIVEHVAIVEDGMAKICAKLLREAQTAGSETDGSAKISGEFLQKLAAVRNVKVEAPERVRPTGEQTIAESLVKMDESRQKLYEMRPLFETVECDDFKFPHPAFGDLTAHEWLALIGGHETRHLAQIERMITDF